MYCYFLIVLYILHSATAISYILHTATVMSYILHSATAISHITHYHCHVIHFAQCHCHIIYFTHCHCHIIHYAQCHYHFKDIANCLVIYFARYLSCCVSTSLLQHPPMPCHTKAVVMVSLRSNVEPSASFVTCYN